MLFPDLEVELFARGAALLASLLTGSPVIRVDDGWLLPGAGLSIVVTRACSATDFFLMVACLLCWQLKRRGRSSGVAITGGTVVAFPLAVFVNSLRVVALAQAHRWFIPHFPDAYGPFLHLAVGVAIFLPSLIALNALLENTGASRRILRF
jgi:exosortase/archaeosortase family protein